MTEEESIMKLILEKENWEEIIYHIVSLEQIDPWNVDLVKLTDSFLKYLNKLQELDFRVPAKIVFVAAILLRLKADYLSIFEEEEETIEKIAQRPFPELGIDPNLIQLGVPIKRIPKRQVTLEELISALQKALVVKERKMERRRAWQARLEAQITEEDITVRIEKIMKEIDEMMKKKKQEQIEFKDIVKKWNRDQIVERFVPILHLEQNQKIRTEQIEFFKQIIIKKIRNQ